MWEYSSLTNSLGLWHGSLANGAVAAGWLATASRLAMTNCCTAPGPLWSTLSASQARLCPGPQSNWSPQAIKADTPAQIRLGVSARAVVPTTNNRS